MSPTPKATTSGPHTVTQASFSNGGSRLIARAVAALVLGGIVFGGVVMGNILADWQVACGQQTDGGQSNADPAKSAHQPQPRSLLDGKTLGQWKITPFGGQDDIAVESGLLKVAAGYPLAGVTYHGEFPTDNYEISLEARKRAGTDFFCCLTLPAGDEHFSFVVGGWGGTVTGISSIDGQDAADNATRSVRKYELDRWYRIRVRVGGKQIQCWIDDEMVVDLNHATCQLSLRPEVIPCKPVGLCNFETQAEYRAIQLLIRPR